MVTFFTSDLHFGHRKLVAPETRTRPFESVPEHDERIIQNWNATVREGDIVFNLGDLEISNKAHTREMVSRLNGTHILIRGNHDDKSDDFYHSCGITLVLSEAYIQNLNYTFWLDHIPMGNHEPTRPDLVRPDATRVYDIPLCGHIHGHWKFHALNCNVGVDVWDYRPVSAFEVIQAYKAKYKHVDLPRKRK